MVTNIPVKITECQVLTPVMVPPSADVVLPCSSGPTAEEVKNVTVSWQLVTGKQRTVILRYPPSAPVGPTEQVLQGRVRFSGNPQEGEVALNVSKVTDTDTNWYRCDLHTQKTQSCYEVRLEVRESQSAAITTAGPVTVITDLTNITPTTTIRDNEEDSGNRGSGAMVVTLVFLLSTCLIAVAAALIICFLRYKGARESRNFDMINLQESPYSNVDIRNSVLNTFYTLAYSEDRCCEQHT
ncbi:uncharacterized protein LOC108927409 [Scleropages formosus]|uniref:uncharacterized protein LOC108927409 n=1 Tax=Scleropages formosus TaxID=113540 RepID=UPI0008783938|nr:uncharacterized protein LOC108927409 [Scleropages formosus]